MVSNLIKLCLIFICLISLIACQDQTSSALPEQSTPTESAIDPNNWVVNPIQTEKITMTDTVTVVVQTNKGAIKLALDHKNAPLTVENFVSYIQSGHYDGTVFHRVIPGFMIQGGGFEPGLQEKPTQAPIQNEANNGLKNLNYTISMARTSDPHSATAEFFINVADNTNLDFTGESGPAWGYAVFGEVVEGQDVVNAIEQASTQQVGSYGDVPIDDIIIESVSVL